MQERLQKIISAAGIMSRRAAEKAITDGKVTVNGQKATLGTKADPALDNIMVSGKLIAKEEKKYYIMLNKPAGYVTTLSDEKHRKIVTDLIKGLDARVYPVGRLDMYSEGLLVLTNDGELANAMMHPSAEMDKTYHVTVRGDNVPDKLRLLRRPIEIDGHKTSPAKVELLENTEEASVLAVTIHEGRNRQVRRLCEAAGLKVLKLLRVSEGPLQLNDLRSGYWRNLTDEELRVLRKNLGID